MSKKPVMLTVSTWAGGWGEWLCVDGSALRAGRCCQGRGFQGLLQGAAPFVVLEVTGCSMGVSQQPPGHLVWRNPPSSCFLP